MKKYTSGSFMATKYAIYKEDTDTITTFPTEIIADGENASATVYGNMQQTGTPTPSTPIQPQECGEKTVNILNPESKSTNQQGDERWGGVFPAGTYYVLNNTAENVYYRDGESSTTSFTIISNRGEVITTANELVIWHGSKSEDIMVAVSSTPISFEPYGYKNPISSANTTTNIYLGEVQTTRRIRKVVFDGTENWNFAGAGTQYAKATLPISSEGTAISTHFVYGSANTSGQFDFYGVTIRFNTYGIADSDTEWKSYLAQQYANGTPVCVWYVLATETTGILNEPLRKIGDYADTVTTTIPTIAAADNINVNTTLKPSTFDLTYTGWHKYDDKKRSGGAWT